MRLSISCTGTPRTELYFCRGSRATFLTVGIECSAVCLAIRHRRSIAIALGRDGSGRVRVDKRHSGKQRGGNGCGIHFPSWEPTRSATQNGLSSSQSRNPARGRQTGPEENPDWIFVADSRSLNREGVLLRLGPARQRDLARADSAKNQRPWTSREHCSATEAFRPI